MKRTQIYLDTETYKAALTQAQATHTTLSQIIRDSIQGQSLYWRKNNQSSNKDFINWIKKFNQSNTHADMFTDTSVEHDHYLYGTPKKYPK